MKRPRLSCGASLGVNFGGAEGIRTPDLSPEATALASFIPSVQEFLNEFSPFSRIKEKLSSSGFKSCCISLVMGYLKRPAQARVFALSGVML